MGIQINFYMLPEDEKEFISYALQRKGIVMIAPHFRSKSPDIVSSLPKPFSEPFWHSVCFWSKNINGNLETKYIEKQGYQSRRNVIFRFENGVTKSKLIAVTKEVLIYGKN